MAHAVLDRLGWRSCVQGVADMAMAEPMRGYLLLDARTLCAGAHVPENRTGVYGPAWFALTGEQVSRVRPPHGPRQVSANGRQVD